MPSSLRWTLLTVTLTIISLASPAFAHDAQVRDLRVMTRNLYSGADMRTVYDATTPSELVEATGKVWQRVRATKFPERARALAAEIAANKPHVVALQEVALWRTQSPGDGPLSPATDVQYDFLQILRQELNARGQNYRVVSNIKTFDLELLAIVNNDVLDVRFTDRNVILVRQDHHVQVIRAKAKRFTNRLTINTHLTGDVHYNRAWSYVDLKLDGRKVRVVNTHLEALAPNIRDAQMQELLNGPASVNGRVVMAGDFNVAPIDPTTQAYANVLVAGFSDIWPTLRGGQSGFTAVQRPNLKNPTSQLSARIDYIFARGRITPRDVSLVGHLPGHRTPSGLWPSDHAGVVATLRLR